MPRYAKKTTIDDLKAYVQNKYNDDWYEAATEGVPEKDYKIKFDWENFNGPDDCDFGDFCGFYKMNDFAIALCCAGGDWETPLYFAVYIDDKNKLRAYIPTVGNVFNFYTKAAFGSDLNTDNDDKMPKNFMYEKHPEFGVSEFDEDEDDPKYTKEYDRWRESINPDGGYGEYDFRDMLDDIASRICVKVNENSLKPKPKNTRIYEEFLKDNPIEIEDSEESNNDNTSDKENSEKPLYAMKSTINDLKDAAKQIIEDISMEQEEDKVNYSWFDVLKSIPKRDFKIEGADDGIFFEGPEGDYEITYDDFFEEDEPWDPSKIGAYLPEVKYYKGNGFAYGLGVIDEGNRPSRGSLPTPKFYVCLYLDESGKIRAFCPTVGNSYCYYTNSTFCADILRHAKSWDSRLPENWSFAKHPEYGLSRYCKDETNPIAYTKEYDRYIDWIISTSSLDLIHQEIKAKICVKGKESTRNNMPVNESRTYEDFIKKYPNEYNEFVNKSTEEFKKAYPNGFKPKRKRTTATFVNPNDLTIVLNKNGMHWSRGNKYGGLTIL